MPLHEYPTRFHHWPRPLLGGCDHLSRTAQYQRLILIGNTAVKDHELVLGLLIRHGDRNRDRVTDKDRLKKPQVLPAVDGARARQNIPEQARDERPTP
jgi:hypothetical protein